MIKEQKQSAIGLVFSKDRDKVLLVERSDIPIWVLPGGGIDLNETPEQAVIREILEETGLQTQIKKHIATYTPINKLAYLTFFFECEEISGTLKTSPESQNVHFFPLKDLPPSFLYIHKNWMYEALKNQSETLKRPLLEITYLNFFIHFLKHPSHVIRAILARLGYPINKKTDNKK